MIKVLFLIHDLGQGGAEKVLVNLVNNMDASKFEITVMTLFDCGENKQFLSPNVKYKSWKSNMIRGNSHFMKLLKPELLHKIIVKGKYDIEIAYLEGPCARVISGCQNADTKLISWIHIEHHSVKKVSASFRSIKEANSCYNKFHKIICVSQSVKKDFENLLRINVPIEIIYNTNESDKIIYYSNERIKNVVFFDNEFKLIGVGKLLKNKGFDRILKISKKLIEEGYAIHTYILGDGPEKNNLNEYINKNNLKKHITLLGYKMNPYKFIARCDLFVCASLAEGFSTAATEALIVGTPVCTVDVAGMKEMLGEHNEYGIVIENNDIALYKAIKQLIENNEIYQFYVKQAIKRGKFFNKENTVKAVEDMLKTMIEKRRSKYDSTKN